MIASTTSAAVVRAEIVLLAIGFMIVLYQTGFQFVHRPAKLDDVLNYIPSRLTALAMTAAAFILGYDGKGAYRIWKRDRYNHASPNSAQTESACAGALGIQLAGDAYYFGELHKKPYIGDKQRDVENGDIVRANRLMYGSALIITAVSVILRSIIIGGLS